MYAFPGTQIAGLEQVTNGAILHDIVSRPEIVKASPHLSASTIWLKLPYKHVLSTCLHDADKIKGCTPMFVLISTCRLMRLKERYSAYTGNSRLQYDVNRGTEAIVVW